MNVSRCATAILDAEKIINNLKKKQFFKSRNFLNIYAIFLPRTNCNIGQSDTT